MRVALDGTPLTVPTGGIRRYTEELFRALRSCFPEDEYVLVSDQLPGSPVGFARCLDARVGHTELPFYSEPQRTVWRCQRT